jgi:signal transduction histidine kinase
MTTPIRIRLSISHILVLLIGMILAGSLAWLAVEGIYLTTQRENLLAQARLTAAALGGTAIPLYPAELYSQTTNVTPGIHTRLLDESGSVVIGVPIPEGEDPVQVPAWEDPGYVPAETLIKRPEIQSALAGIGDTAIRKISSTGGSRVLYAAAPVLNEEGEVISLVYLATPLPSRGLPFNQSLQLVGAVAAAGILAGIAGIFLARGIAQPLENLDQAAAAVSQGDLEQQVPIEEKITELKNLGQRFNMMTESLRNSDQAKNAFITDVTHELRTPLTVIKGTIETLEDGALDDQVGRGPLIKTMGRETQRLIRLVNDLLILTRADASVLQLDLKSIDLMELVKNRCETLSSLASLKYVTFALSEEDLDQHNRFLVRGDKDRLAQILDNLLDNAIRFAPEGSSISIELEKGGGIVACSIIDSGPGIPAEHLPFIFERFYRVDSSRDRSSGGYGLGLAIARSLVLAMGGEIQAESQEGVGTTITFQIPAQ